MRWRLLVHTAADGFTNMAVDEALLESTALPEGVPTLRLYRWRPPCVSFGFRQQAAQAIAPGALEELGYAAVRRLTGGRALLHQHELTYSLTASSAAAPFRDLTVKSTYRTANRALREALTSLGLDLDPEPASSSGVGPGPDNRVPHLPCISVATGHEITVGGKKLVASAQRWRRRSFLQHGSIFLALERDRWKWLTGLAPFDRFPAVAIAELLPAPPTEERLIEALHQGFESLFGTSATIDELSIRENDRVAELELKYRAETWNRLNEVDPASVDRTEAVW